MRYYDVERRGDSDARNVIAYAPALRRDDLSLNIILIRAKTMGKRSMERALGEFSTKMPRGVRLMPFARCAPRIASRIYGDIQRTGQIAADFSMLGAHCAAGRAGLYRSLRDEMSPLEAMELSASLIHHRRMAKISSVAHRMCPLCSEEDVDLRGFSTWRASHQAPWLAHCTFHGCELVEAPYAFTRRGHGVLPGLPHEIAKDDLASIATDLSPSDGYAALMAFWHSACTEEPQDVCIENWMSLVTKAKAEVGQASELTRAVDVAIQERWGMRVCDVGRVLGFGASFTSAPEIEFRSRPSDIARRFITLDALRSLGLCHETESLQSQSVMSFATHKNSEATRDELFNRLVMASGATVSALSTCRSMLGWVTKGSRMLELHVDRGYRFSIAAACDEQLLRDILDHSGNTLGHWARHELDRRARAVAL